VTRGFRIE